MLRSKENKFLLPKNTNSIILYWHLNLWTEIIPLCKRVVTIRDTPKYFWKISMSHRWNVSTLGIADSSLCSKNTTLVSFSMLVTTTASVVSIFFLLLFSLPLFRFPQWLSNKESNYNAGDTGLTPGSGRSPGGGHSNSLPCFCLENPMDRGIWWAAVHGVARSQTWQKWQHARMHALPLYAQECFNHFDGITQWVHSHDHSFGFVTK